MIVIIDIIKWYLVLCGTGLIGFPIVFGFLKKLPGRGFVFSRSLGLILISFLYWLTGSLGFLRNSTGSLFCSSCFSFGCDDPSWRSGNFRNGKADGDDVYQQHFEIRDFSSE